MRHLTSTQNLSRKDAIALLDTAEVMAQVGEREQKKTPALRGKTVVNVFFEDSTRTRTSFELAAKRLSADVINFSAKGSSVSKGESLKDTAQTLQAMGADAVVIRHPSSGAAEQLAHSGWIDAAVVNAGDGTHEHPTQALLDAFTMRRHFAASRDGFGHGTGLDGLKVLIVGDLLHSRVARSNLWLLKTLGADLTLCAPPTLLPQRVDSWPASVTYDLDAAVSSGVDVLMMLRVQSERMHAAFFPSAAEYSRHWGLDEKRFRRFLEASAPDSALMHPGPMNRGLEISSVAADSPRSLILDQVTNGISVRMAALYSLLLDAPTIDSTKVVTPA